MTSVLIETPMPRNVRLTSGTVPPIQAPEALAHPTRAGAEAYEMASRRVRVVLSASGGVEWVEGDGAALAASVGPVDAAGANLLVGPRSARRECFPPGGSLLEAVQLPDALPGVVLQWSVPGPLREGTIRIHARLLPGSGDGDVLLHRAPGILWVARGTSGVLAWLPGVESVPEVELRDDGLHVSWDAPAARADAPATLLLQAAPPEGVWSAPSALAGAEAHHRRGESAAWGEGDPGVVVDTGVEEMDLGIRWIRSWTRDRLLTVPGSARRIHPHPSGATVPPETDGLPRSIDPWMGQPAHPAWVALGAAASGDWEAGRGALSALVWDAPHSALLSALALAQWTAWTGEAAPLAAHAARVSELLAPGATHAGVAPGAVASIRRAVAAAGEAGEIPGLATLAGGLEDDPAEPPASGRGGGLRLPMAGVRPPEPVPGLLATGRDRVPVADRLEEALHLRQSVGSVARAPHLLGQGLGPLLLWELVTGVLGAVPDATFGRLTLSPLLPPNWTRFVATGLRAGEGSLEVGYERSGGHVCWTLRPLEGSVPLMVVFEPWQPLTQVRALRVDGVPAELDLLEDGGWTRVKVQIPADAVRVVELEGEPLSSP